MSLIGSIKYHLTNLTNFPGRETRGQFWPYAGVVVALSFAGMAAVMMPEMNASFARMQRFAAEHPELATVTQGPGSYSISIRGNHPELMPDIGLMMTMMGVVFAVVVALLAAAVARRLHDRGKNAAWGLMPIPFIVFAGILMPQLFADFSEGTPNLGLFFALFVNNFLYLASLVYLIILLAGDSTKGENRYGPKPS